MDRRKFLKKAILLGASSLLPGDFVAHAGARRSPTLARSKNASKFVQLFLNGGIDALSLLPPKGSLIGRNYKKARGALHVSNGLPLPGIDGFTLHPLMRNLHRVFIEGGARFYLGAATGIDSLSHFEQVDHFCYGGSSEARPIGYLTKVLRSLGVASDQLAYFTFGGANSKSLRGDYLGLVGSDLLLRDVSEIVDYIQYLGGQGNTFFAKECSSFAAIAELAESCESASALAKNINDLREIYGFQKPLPKNLSTGQLPASAWQAAQVLRSNSKIPIITIEDFDWDTHVQMQVELQKKFVELDQAIGNLYFHGIRQRKDLNHAALVVSEFGRALSLNTGNGTEHGNGGVAILISRPENIGPQKFVAEDLNSLVNTEIMPFQRKLGLIARDALAIPFPSV